MPDADNAAEERQLNALVMVDLSASKSFGTGPKHNALVASEIAAILENVILLLWPSINPDGSTMVAMIDRMERSGWGARARST